MKRINVLFLGAAVAATALFSNCKKTTEDTSFSNPSVEVRLAGVVVNSNDSVVKAEGTALTFDIKFAMGDQSDKLTQVNITSVMSGKTFPILDSALNKGIFNTGASSLTYTYKTSVGSSAEIITFTVTDKQNRVGTAVIKVKPLVVAPVAGDFTTKTAILFGAQDNADNGSSYSLSLNKVLTLSAAKANSADVDMIYYYGNTNKATLSAPSSSDVQSVFNSTRYSASYVASWVTKNTTNFKLITSITDYDNVTLADFNTAIASVSTDDQARTLAAGNIIAFKTATTSGLIKVTDLTLVAGSSNAGSAGSITISIKTKK